MHGTPAECEFASNDWNCKNKRLAVHIDDNNASEGYLVSMPIHPYSSYSHSHHQQQEQQQEQQQNYETICTTPQVPGNHNQNTLDFLSTNLADVISVRDDNANFEMVGSSLTSTEEESESKESTQCRTMDGEEEEEEEKERKEKDEEKDEEVNKDCGKKKTNVYSRQEMTTSSQLTDLIVKKKSIKKIKGVFLKYNSKLDASHLSVICHSLSTAIILETPTQKQKASELFLSSLTLWSNDEVFPPIRVLGKEGMDFAKIFFAAATLIKKEVPIPTTDIRFVKFIESVRLYFTSLNAEETAQCMWAAATLGIKDKQLIDALIEACHIFSNRFTRQDVDKCMWAVDVLKIADFNLLSCLVKASVRLSSSS
jgi:hypothetical protein